MPRVLITPGKELLPIAEAKKHLRLADNQDEDALIEALSIAARERGELYTARAFTTQTWDFYLDKFPDDGAPIIVPLPPLQSVTSIKYYDTNGTQQTWPSTNYLVDVVSEPGRIALAPEASYPSIQTRINAVIVRFIAGYGSPEAVPRSIVLAMKQMIGHWYEHRESVIGGITIANEIPLAAAALLCPYRILRAE